MSKVKIGEEEFERMSEIMDCVEMPDDDYIPSEEDIFNYIWRCPDKYMKYLIWFSEHRPQARSEDEKSRLKEISKITNSSIVIE